VVKPRISLVSSSAATCFGGAETYTLNAARILSADCEVHLVAGKGQPTDDLKNLLGSSGITLHALRFISRDSIFSRNLIRGWFRTKLNELDVEALSLLCPPRRIRRVLERSDVVEVNYATESLIFPLLDSRVRKIIHFHGPWLSPIYAHLKERINKSADVLVTCSEWSKGELEKRLPAKSQVEVIYNGVDTDAFHPVDEPDFATVEAYDRRLPRFGTVGRLGAAKGTDLLMEVARTMQGKAEFFAAGPLDRAFAKKMETKGRPTNFHVLGAVPNHQLPRFYGFIDCFVLPSLFETFPITLLEAMASKKAVVASRTGGIPEAVEHNKQGILIPPNDGAALKNAIGAMIENRNFMSDLGESGRVRALEKFSIEKMGRRIRELYLCAA
jgi:glycosyltransferase involved in cell wall biosynthesis